MQAAELNALSLKDLTLISQKLTKNKIKISKNPISYYDVPYFVSSNKEIKKFYNWEPKKNIEEIANDIYSWQLNSFNIIKKYLIKFFSNCYWIKWPVALKLQFFYLKGFDVVGIDNNERMKFFGLDGDTRRIKNFLKNKYSNYTHYNCDIRNKEKINKIFKKYKKRVKFLLHAAAQPSHDWAYSNIRKDFEINATGTLNILEGAKNNFQIQFLFLHQLIKFMGNPNRLNLIEKKNRWAPPKIQNFTKVLMKL